MTPQGQVDYTYDAAGRRTTMTVFGQPTITYAYDNANRLTQITQPSKGGSNLGVWYYTYDAENRLTQVVDFVSGTITCDCDGLDDYDNANRVTGITYKLGVTVLANLTYTYDAAGNRTQIGGTFARTGLPAAVSSAVYDAANRLTNWGATPLTYDNNGNLLSDGTNTYTWNVRNQLASMTGASFVYDGLGRRQKKTIGASPTEFLYDGVNPVQESNGPTVLANILGGLGIDEVFVRTGSAGARNFLTNALGSTVALADSAGTIQTEYTYEPFGKTTASGISSTNPFQYTGRENDSTGLYYYRARYYHLTFQRFIKEDPIDFYGGDFNLYSYVRQNPLKRKDPSGLFDPFDVPLGCTLGMLTELSAAGGKRKDPAGAVPIGCVAGLIPSLFPPGPLGALAGGGIGALGAAAAAQAAGENPLLPAIAGGIGGAAGGYIGGFPGALIGTGIAIGLGFVF